MGEFSLKEILFIVIVFGYLSSMITSFLLASHYRNWKNLNKASSCDNCNHKIDKWRLIPIFGSLISGYKCNYCKEKFSWKLGFMELTSYLLFSGLFLYMLNNGFELNYLKIFCLSIGSSFFALFAYEDWETSYISDLYIIPSLILFIYPFFHNLEYWVLSIGSLYLFKVLADTVVSFIKKEETIALGEGDILLLSFIWLIFSNIQESLYILIIMGFSAIIMGKLKNSGESPLGPNLMFALIFYLNIKGFLFV